MASPFDQDAVWLDKYKYDDVEKQCQEFLANPKKAIEQGDNLNVKSQVLSQDADKMLHNLEKENKEMQAVIKSLQAQVSKLESRLASLEGHPQGVSKTNGIDTAPKSQKITNSAPDKEDDDDDVDLFGSDDEQDDDEANKLREKRVKEYSDKKSKKPQLIAKSSVILDIKPWDNETNMQDMEKKVRHIAMDGLLWGASKLVPVAFGIKKLQIVSVVEDDKVSIEELQEAIEAMEDLVQSVDVAAFNKI